MEQHNNKWSRLVFRLRGLPNTINTLEDVVSFLGKLLDDIPIDSIRVFSLATTLTKWEYPPSKVATIMFTEIPEIVRNAPEGVEWDILYGPYNSNRKLILDIHFQGMTPLNDIRPQSNHLYDCIAISGLASHPFGSWQPRDSNKTFMWIRDGLPNNLPGVRTIIYGYDTNLPESQSFQDVEDIARGFNDELRTYGWNSPFAKPVAFLAHSLGGLVLKDALIKVADNESDSRLLNLIRGAVFFGVPNLGMSQKHLRPIIKDNPNQVLVDQLAESSNYVRQLDRAFFKHSFNEKLRFFWAYETYESPTVIVEDGRMNPNGPRVILVSKQSATCRFVETNQSVTFPISATHSDMVKLRSNSPTYNSVVSKLREILSLHHVVEHDEESGTRTSIQSAPIADEYNNASANQQSNLLTWTYNEDLESNITSEIDVFKQKCHLTEAEEIDFERTSSVVALGAIYEMQMKQLRNRDLMYMKRLEPFLVSMQQFGEVGEALKLSASVPSIMTHVWGPMKYVLWVTFEHREAFNSVLNAYQEIGELLPKFEGAPALSTPNTDPRHLLIMVYKDILWFHGEIIRNLKQRHWVPLFGAFWRDFAPFIELIKQNATRIKWIVGNKVSINLEEIQFYQASAVNAFEREKANQDVQRWARVIQWLSAYNCDTEQDRHRKTRSICQDPGRWLLNRDRFQHWFNPEDYSAPLLWLSGKPGAGKTILASIVIDEARRITDATVAFFYCKYGDNARDSFISVVRSLLAQLLVQNHHLLSYLFRKASISNETLLTSETIAKEMLETALGSCVKTYLIIDGIDECGPNDRKEIINWFQATAKALLKKNEGSLKCLFISQDDEMFQDGFQHLPTMKVTDGNKEDLKRFAMTWHQHIENRFGVVKQYNIGDIISAQAQGMFIFAELFAKYLADQPHREALLKELNPNRIPVELDHVYARILHRVVESKGRDAVNHARHILGWIVCAQRPLKWHEIQGAACIDLEAEDIAHNRKLINPPNGLFASLVEVREDGTVELVHETARNYLNKKFIDIFEANYSLAMLSLSYLAFPQVDKHRGDEEIRRDLLSGSHAFYDYASACWSIHLQKTLVDIDSEEKLNHLQETLEMFIKLHWSPTYKTLIDVKRVQKSLTKMQDSELYDKITQAVGWAKKQSGERGLGPNPDEALDLWKVTGRIRSVLEDMHSKVSIMKLQPFHGTKWFKCPRVNCHRYYQGFETAHQRKAHVNKHDRPFLCFVGHCHMKLFGCATARELKIHLFKYHGIIEFNDEDEAEVPDLRKGKASSQAKTAAAFKCTLCLQGFTTSHSLKSHMSSHGDVRPSKCSICGELFKHKSDCKRHERSQHGPKPYICTGNLKDSESKWGCRTEFRRMDQLVQHFKSNKGQQCLRPLMMEKRQGSDTAEELSDVNIFVDQLGENADKLLSAGARLPSFGEFLQICGLDKSAVRHDLEATS